MHNLTKIKLFRSLLWITYPFSLVLVYPLVFLKKKNKTGLFLFFDRYTLGGAQRVHLDILNSVNDLYKQVYFTRLSPNGAFREEFYNTPNASVKDIHFWCDNLLIRLFTVHYFAFYINRHKTGHVFSSNSTFFYDMLPFIKNGIIKTELLHNFTLGKNGMEFFGLANYRYLHNRLTVDVATYNNILTQYEKYGINSVYSKRVQCIEPGVMISSISNKDYSKPVNILYAGRGGAQKRPHLLDAIAQHFISKSLPVHFHFAGDVIDELSDYVKKHSILHGQITDQKIMYSLYQQCHSILMTSAYEGFPMLIKEGMANGCVPIVTALDGNKSHLKHEKNALLIHQPENENLVVQQGIELIQRLLNNQSFLEELSQSAYQYASEHFDKKQFVLTYRSLLLLSR